MLEVLLNWNSRPRRRARRVERRRGGLHSVASSREVRGRRLGPCAFILWSGFFQRADAMLLWFLHHPLSETTAQAQRRFGYWISHFGWGFSTLKAHCAGAASGIASIGPCGSHFPELGQASISLHIMRLGSLLANSLIW